MSTSLFESVCDLLNENMGEIETTKTISESSESTEFYDEDEYRSAFLEQAMDMYEDALNESALIESLMESKVFSGLSKESIKFATNRRHSGRDTKGENSRVEYHDGNTNIQSLLGQGHSVHYMKNGKEHIGIHTTTNRSYKVFRNGKETTHSLRAGERKEFFNNLHKEGMKGGAQIKSISPDIRSQGIFYSREHKKNLERRHPKSFANIARRAAEKYNSKTDYNSEANKHSRAVNQRNQKAMELHRSGADEFKRRPNLENPNLTHDAYERNNANRAGYREMLGRRKDRLYR